MHLQKLYRSGQTYAVCLRIHFQTTKNQRCSIVRLFCLSPKGHSRWSYWPVRQHLCKLHMRLPSVLLVQVDTSGRHTDHRLLVGRSIVKRERSSITIFVGNRIGTELLQFSGSFLTYQPFLSWLAYNPAYSTAVLWFRVAIIKCCVEVAVA